MTVCVCVLEAREAGQPHGPLLSQPTCLRPRVKLLCGKAIVVWKEACVVVLMVVVVFCGGDGDRL